VGEIEELSSISPWAEKRIIDLESKLREANHALQRIAAVKTYWSGDTKTIIPSMTGYEAQSFAQAVCKRLGGRP